MPGLMSLLRRDTGIGEKEKQQLAVELRTKELPEANDELRQRIQSALSANGSVDSSARALLNGEAEQEQSPDNFLARLGTVESAISRLSAHVVENPSAVDDPVTVTQQLQYLAAELGVLEENLTLIGGAIGGFRKRISTLLQQVETARRSVSAKEDRRSALENGRAASNAVLRQREKEIGKLSGQIDNASSKLQRKSRQLGELEHAGPADIPVEEGNGAPARTVGTILSDIEARLQRLDPARAPVGDPQTHFPDALKRVESNGNGKVTPDAKPGVLTDAQMRKHVDQANVELDTLVAPMVAAFEEALRDATDSTVSELQGGILRSSDFAKAVQARYKQLLKERGLENLSSKWKGASGLIDALPKGFEPSMLCIEQLQAQWEAKQRKAEQAVRKMEQQYHDQWQSARRGKVQVVPLQRKRHTRKGLQEVGPPQPPIFSTKYRREQSSYQEAQLKLGQVNAAKKAAMIGSPLKAGMRWFRQKAAAKVAEVEQQQKVAKKKN